MEYLSQTRTAPPPKNASPVIESKRVPDVQVKKRKRSNAVRVADDSCVPNPCCASIAQEPEKKKNVPGTPQAAAAAAVSSCAGACCAVAGRAVGGTSCVMRVGLTATRAGRAVGRCASQIWAAPSPGTPVGGLTPGSRNTRPRIVSDRPSGADAMRRRLRIQKERGRRGKVVAPCVSSGLHGRGRG